MRHVLAIVTASLALVCATAAAAAEPPAPKLPGLCLQVTIQFQISEGVEGDGSYVIWKRKRGSDAFIVLKRGSVHFSGPVSRRITLCNVALPGRLYFAKAKYQTLQECPACDASVDLKWVAARARLS